MMCSRCGKRPAVVFITAMQGNMTKNEGLCILCAKESHIPQISEYFDKMGLKNEDIEAMSNTMMEFMGNIDDEGDTVLNPPPFDAEQLSSMFTNFFDNKEKNDEYSRPDVVKEQDLPDFLKNSNFGELGEEQRRAKRTKAKAKEKEKEKPLKFVDAYCTNLTKRAFEGKLDTVIGRDKEIDRVMQILSRRTKNNPCLIGEPGVGKTAIAEGIAQHINTGDVPFNIADKKLYLLDMTALVAGTQYRGQFESRVKNLLAEVKAEGNIILFIDEVHSLVGAGDADGAMNAANIFKPALSRGDVQIIGATTFTEYRKYIEKDSALERRFQPVTVEEPNVEDTISILRGIKHYYEDFHKVHISDYLIKSCAVLSERYINDRFLPDKAIDLLDESCARSSIRHKVIGEYYTQLKKKETAEKLKASISEDIEVFSDADYRVLAEIQGDIILTEQELERLEPLVKNIQVTETDISKVIELWTGIPASKIEESEFHKFKTLESKLAERVVGQQEAITLLTKAIKRSRVQLEKRRRPASFVFVGPTGVGKTELVKSLASELFDSADPLIRLDMSEFMEKHAVSRIIGSPPGYIGYDEAGQLTEKVRRKPYSVVLFDEIEKAHPDVMNILLQILDEGKVNDAQGRSVSFENTVIIMTSNAGSTDKSVGVGFAKTEEDITRDKAIKALKEFLRPEFIGRLDEIVVFKPLTQKDYEKIAALMLDEMREPLGEKDCALVYTDEALALIAEKSFKKKMGARDIKRVIRVEIEDKIADYIIENAGYIKQFTIFTEGDELMVDAALK